MVRRFRPLILGTELLVDKYLQPQFDDYSTRHNTRRERTVSNAEHKEPKLVLFLRAILAKLAPGQTVSERFNQQELEQLADEFELKNSDWQTLFEIVLAKKGLNVKNHG
jgi:hypothetical protein